MKKIIIYDLDGTIIDSSHRAKHIDGKLDLEHWKANNTKENIFADDLLPLYWQLRQDWLDGHHIVLCTAREIGKYDKEYLQLMNIPYNTLISRPVGNTLPDSELKKKRLSRFFNLKWTWGREKIFYDDNQKNLADVSLLGVEPRYAPNFNSGILKAW